jgi:nucleoside-diphosphate-sugar epimerase
MDLIDEIFKNLNWTPRTIDRQLDKPVGVKSRASDNTKSLRLLGWEPSHTLADGVSRTLNWYKEHVTKEQMDRLDHLLMER